MSPRRLFCLPSFRSVVTVLALIIVRLLGLHLLCLYVTCPNTGKFSPTWTSCYRVTSELDWEGVTCHAAD